MADLIDIIQQASTSHDYTGGSNAGNLSIDGDTGSAYSANSSGGSGAGVGANVYSDHTFASPIDIVSIYFKASAGGSADGPYGHYTNGNYGLYYKHPGDVSWTSIVAATYSTGDSGGNTSANVDQTFTVNLTNISAIRAFAGGFGNNSGDGSSSAYAYLYEVQAFGYSQSGFSIMI